MIRRAPRRSILHRSSQNTSTTNSSTKISATQNNTTKISSTHNNSKRKRSSQHRSDRRRSVLRRPMLTSLTALTAAGAVAGGLALTSEDPSQAATGMVTRPTAHAAPQPSVQAPKPGAARHRVEADAAEHRAMLAQAAKKRAAKAKAARERRAEQERVSRARERARLQSIDPRSAARSLLADFGWGSQFGCLDSLWQKESGWDPHAQNPTSGAYGIPQALPGSKMGSAGSDWRTNPITQIKWGLQYIRSTYGSPCAAWSHSQSSGWY